MERFPFLSQFFERRPEFITRNAALGTMTGTANAREDLDHDQNTQIRELNQLSAAVLGTQTLTETRESTDADPAHLAALGTQTMTRVGGENNDTDMQHSGRAFMESVVL